MFRAREIRSRTGQTLFLTGLLILVSIAPAFGDNFDDTQFIRGNFNADGSSDAVDLGLVIDHIFFGGAVSVRIGLAKWTHLVPHLSGLLINPPRSSSRESRRRTRRSQLPYQ